MGKMSRSKGCAGERDCAAFVRNSWELPAERTAQRRGDAGDSDLQVPRLHIEVKRCEAFQMQAAIDQALADVKGDHVPVVMHRKNHGEWILVMRAADAIDFARAIALARKDVGKPIIEPEIVAIAADEVVF